jgi:CheY-like chemotaxis protein
MKAVIMSQQENPPRQAILVVEDEAILRMNAQGVLEENGFEVLEARDAHEALHILEKRPDVRLVFTDIQMPGRLNGLDLLREVHRLWPSVLLIATSARARPHKDEIADDGRFVAKPYSEKELIAQVNDLISKH